MCFIFFFLRQLALGFTEDGFCCAYAYSNNMCSGARAIVTNTTVPRRRVCVVLDDKFQVGRGENSV